VVLVATCIAASLTSCTLQRAARPTATSTTRPTTSVGLATVLATGLAVPWGIAFLPDGSALVSERASHRILRVTESGQLTSIGTVPGVAADAGEGGLLGLALSPHFNSDALVYAYLTSTTDNRIVRMTYRDGTLGTPDIVFTGIPKAAIHNGGRLAFGPDGMLYATAGDAGQKQRAPEVGYLGGKVLRMTPDGRSAPGNPFAGSVVYTVGHRNPQGLAWGPDGSLYEAEFGQDTLDEINLLEPGKNYGWPTVEGTVGPANPTLTAPLLTWDTGDASPSGLTYAGDSLWLATLQGERVYRIPLLGEGIEGRKVGRPSSILDGVYGRLRTVVLSPDGSLWVSTSNRDGRGSPGSTDDRIIRVPLTR
jgi:glucose/arabinose dehydrogenase